MNCPKCGSTEAVKNDIVNKKQRYKCKLCDCNYTVSTLSRTPVEKRIEAIKLYLEGVGFRGIECLTGIPHTTVMTWVKNLGQEIEQKVTTVELDEMWHFIQKNTKMLGGVSLG